MTAYRGKLKTWYDKRIEPGTGWDPEIKKNLELADIILLTISSNSLESEYIRAFELPYALEKQKAGDVRAIPVILDEVNLQRAPFKHLQALPSDAKPVTRWGERDRSWKHVVKGIENVAESIRKRRRQFGTYRMPAIPNSGDVLLNSGKYSQR